jgi:hypothetical protein
MYVAGIDVAVTRLCAVIFLGDVFDQVDDSIRVAVFVVVPVNSN